MKSIAAKLGQFDPDAKLDAIEKIAQFCITGQAMLFCGQRRQLQQPRFGNAPVKQANAYIFKNIQHFTGAAHGFFSLCHGIGHRLQGQQGVNAVDAARPGDFNGRLWRRVSGGGIKSKSRCPAGAAFALSAARYPTARR